LQTPVSWSVEFLALRFLTLRFFLTVHFLTVGYLTLHAVSCHAVAFPGTFTGREEIVSPMPGAILPASGPAKAVTILVIVVFAAIKTFLCWLLVLEDY
jgi:hypothetical protein